MSRIKYSKRLSSLYGKGKGDIFDAFMMVADCCYGSTNDSSNGRDAEVFESGMAVMEGLKPNENIYLVECGEYILYFKGKTVSDVISRIKAQESYCE